MSGAEKSIELVLRRLKKRYPDEMHTSLNHSNPWELLVATILSAQTTDAQVDRVTPALFKKVPNPKSMAKLKPKQLYPYVKTLGLYRVKAKHLVGTAKILHEHFHDRVPNTIAELTMLPGVGRKTANVVISNAFNANEGIAIDTHCITVANRLFLYRTKDAKRIEEHMTRVVPKSDWGNLTHLFIALGRDVCTARKKYCSNCVLKDICPSSDAK